MRVPRIPRDAAWRDRGPTRPFVSVAAQFRGVTCSISGAERHDRSSVAVHYPILTVGHRAVSPFLTGLATIGAVVRTFWYASRVRTRLDTLVRSTAAQARDGGT